tara:strand:+ start:8141 stop:9823 length:1683 start_codon:yes stop_codon:yes gene_type:complete
MNLVGKILTTWMASVMLAQTCFALVPLESLILGEYSATVKSRETDPLFNVFQSSKDRLGKGSEGDRERLALYRGFIEEGENLQQFCSKDRSQELRYPSNDQFEQASRTMLSTLQYIGLDLLVRALPAYGKALQVSSEDFEQFSTNLVGSWCSQNLTIISKKELLKNLMFQWNEEQSDILPSIEDNVFFPQKLMSVASKEERLKREFYWSTELFKSFCSWSNTTEDTRLMTPLVRDPVIMAFIARQMDGKKLTFNKRSQTISLESNGLTNRIACRGVVCRKSDEAEFRRRMPRAIGSPDVYSDARRLFCSRFREIGINYNDPDERVKSLLERRTLEENLLLSGQFKALLSSVPNFLIWSNTYDQSQGLMRASFDRSWTDWASAAIEKLKGSMTYEEALTVELVGRDLFYNPYRKRFSVHFDVNQGEFDRVNKVAGKMSVKFDLKISNKMLNWLRRNWISYDPTQKVERRDLINKFKGYIKKDVEKARSKLIIPPWRGDIEEIITTELLDQFSKFLGAWDYPADGFSAIPVHLHYGPFAMRLMRYRHLVDEKSKSLAKDDKN